MIHFMSGEKYASPARSNPLVSWMTSDRVADSPCLAGELFARSLAAGEPQPLNASINPLHSRIAIRYGTLSSGKCGASDEGSGARLRFKYSQRKPFAHSQP